MTPQYQLVSSFLLAAAAFLTFGAGTAAAQGRAARDIPYATDIFITVPYGSNSAGAISPHVVPLNKRLIIEFVSATVTSQSGDKAFLALNDLVNGVGRAYAIPLTLVDAGATEVYRASQLVKLNHDGNGVNGPAAHCTRYFNTLAPVTCHVTLSGYLVDK